ncbi:MAG TPA: hypothetical protein VHN15_03420, partial [Thermoanaerobaculia bacterium]|nr:hypothetical protein [Thermoanaerobaculia bacterium]
METRRLLLAITLSFAVLIVWTYFFPPENTQQPDPSRPAASSETAEVEPGVEPGAAPGAPARPGATVRPAPTAPAGPPVAAAAEQEVVLQGERARAVFSNRGAQLRSMQVRQSWQKE